MLFTEIDAAESGVITFQMFQDTSGLGLQELLIMGGFPKVGVPFQGSL